VDLQRVTEESLMGKNLAAQIQKLQDEIEAERSKKQTELEKRDQELQALQQELDNQRSVLSVEAAEKKAAEIRQKTRDRQAFFEDGQRELRLMEQRAQQQAGQAQQEYQTALQPHIEQVARAKGIDILIDAQVTHFATAAFDVSQEVIVAADTAARGAGGDAGGSQP
jgi:outer membrane protein